MIDVLLDRDRSGVSSSKLLGSLYTVFSLLEEMKPSTGGCGDPSKEQVSPHIEKALRFVDLHYQHPITVRHLAAYVGLERTYFTKLFTKQTGTPPQQYLLRYRIGKSLELMKSTDLSIGQIGASVGIGDLPYFSRIFKQWAGMSPRRFASRLQEGIVETRRSEFDAKPSDAADDPPER